jgi:signal transduction histidine kinase/DNA-binding response OmpR family regulator
MITFIQKRLGYKIMVAMLAIILFVLVAEIYMRIYFGTKDRLEIASALSSELADAVYAGIKYPMEVGDKQAIVRELTDIREKMHDVEVFICDFEQEIVYSTHDNTIKSGLRELIQNKAIILTLTQTLKTGVTPEIDPRNPFEDFTRGKRHLVVMRPILNEPDCYHCHGSSRKVLGGIVVRLDAERTFAQVIAQRNRTIMIVMFLIPVAIVLIYLMVNRLVRVPVESLAEKAKKFAEGDMSAAVDVKTEDEIGILGNTFNNMVERVSSTSKALEAEVQRKTDLLNERTRLLTLLEVANRELRELDKLKSTFLANMSHELRTPMNAIIGYTDLLLDELDGPVNEEQNKSLKKVAANARHLLQLINDVLDISKIESGKMKLSPKEIDFKWLIESIIPTFEPQIKQKNLTISYNIEENLPFFFADEDKVKQILINLISNAIKFTHMGGVTISAKKSNRGIIQGEEPIFAEICVQDSGIGIKEEDVGKVFDKFVQVDLTTVRQYEGTGLGLSIARGLVSLHKGVIWVTSKYGEGSTFCFTIPIKKDILEKPAEPVVEQKMAEGISTYFGVPVDTLLKEPTYAGKPIRCWEYVRCGQPSCPAYGSNESRCWMILGTHCAGMKLAAYPEKVDFCKGCELIKGLILGSEERERLTSSGLSIAEALKGKKTILAIDDNPEAIDIIRKYLGGDYAVVGLLGGEGAVERAKELRPLAITLDIMMPRKDGWQVLQELKNTPETQDIPVIILSIVDDMKMGFSLGAAEYLVKPVDKEMLLHKLKNFERMKKIKRILVVDTEPETVRMIGSLLKEAEYQVTTVYNSTDARHSLHAFKPDLIVMNPTAPEVGFDVIEDLKTEENLKEIPVILVTHKDLSEKEIDYLNGRIQGILNKGILTKENFLNELKNTISKVNKTE